MVGSLFVVLFLATAISGLRWSERLRGGVGPFQVCSGQDIQLFFNFTLDPGERLKGVVWGCQPEGKEEGVLATYTDDHFVPMAAFSGRLSHLQDGGIELSCATILESGNYSIAVSTEDSNSQLHVHRKTVSVTVLDTPKTWTGNLDVIRKEEAVRDVTTGAWHVQLSCGNFSDRGHPPVDVTWTSPTGSQLPNTAYHEGFFTLLLPNPLQGGKFSCMIDSSQSAARCLDGDSPLLDTVSVEVDQTAGRFSLLEAQQQELKEQVDRDREAWKEALKNSHNRADVLEQRLDNATLQGPPPVSFHAILTSNVTTSEDFVLKPNKVIHNQGQGYDLNTGHFTAPVNGTYFLIGTIATVLPKRYGELATSATLSLKKEGGITIDEAHASLTRYDTLVKESCLKVVYLRGGEKVWLEAAIPRSRVVFKARVTSFSGFRI